MKKSFIITIDTEGDNIWSRSIDVKVENAKYLIRFQNLCDKYGFKVTYLTNYEMAESKDFIKLGKSIINNNTGDWPKILEEILNERQRSQDEQNERLGQTFPTTDIEVTSPTVVKVEDKELTPEQNLYNQQIETSNFTQYKIKVDTLP